MCVRAYVCVLACVYACACVYVCVYYMYNEIWETFIFSGLVELKAVMTKTSDWSRRKKCPPQIEDFRSKASIQLPKNHVVKSRTTVNFYEQVFIDYILYPLTEK